MGRLIKNPPMVRNTGIASSTVLPSGTTIERPPVPDIGQVRINTDTGDFEYWDSTSWNQVATIGLSVISKDSFTGDGSTTSFVMTQSVVDETDVLAYIGGVFQNPGVSFTVDGSTSITFTSPPPNLETIVVLHGYNRN